MLKQLQPISISQEIGKLINHVLILEKLQKIKQSNKIN